MRVFFRSHQTGPEKRCRTEYEEVGEPEFCCETMEAEWRTLVVFGFKKGLRCRTPAATLVTNHFLGDGDTLQGITPIFNCPWCGAPIDMADVPADTTNPEQAG